MRIDVQDKHFNTVFTVLNDRIEVRGSNTHLVIKEKQIQEWGGRVLYEIRNDRLEDRKDSQNYWLKTHAGSGTIEGKHFHFNYSGKRVHTNKGNLLIFSEKIEVGVAAVLAIEYITGRAFERGLSDLEKLGILLGGAEMILALEKDGLGLKNLARFSFYHNLSPKDQNILLIALGTKYAAQNGLSLGKVMGLIAFGALEKHTQKALVDAYSGYRFLKKGDFSLLGKAFIASGFDEMTMNRFVKFYAAKEYFEQKNILVSEQAADTEGHPAGTTLPAPTGAKITLKKVMNIGCLIIVSIIFILVLSATLKRCYYNEVLGKKTPGQLLEEKLNGAHQDD
jgi:hypothetical protein